LQVVKGDERLMPNANATANVLGNYTGMTGIGGCGDGNSEKCLDVYHSQQEKQCIMTSNWGTFLYVYTSSAILKAWCHFTRKEAHM